MGKTTCAAATAVAAADAGRRVLVVSTDPAHSLGDALATPLGPRPRRLGAARPRTGRAPSRGRRGELAAVELDADRALERWMGARRRALHAIAERGTYLDADDIDGFFRLSLPGVDELVGLVELVRLARREPRDLVVVDTAPTGHTLRLLGMPATLRRIAAVLSDMQAKHRFLSESLGSGYRRDDTDVLIDELDREGRGLNELLRDPQRCRFSWVLLPEILALEEARDGVAALEAAGITVAEIVVNVVSPPADPRCADCAARGRAEGEALAAVRASFPGRPLRIVRALASEPRGPVALRRVAASLRASPRTHPAPPRGRPARLHEQEIEPPADWLSLIAPPGRTLLLFGGKGGVGKTTCATATALGLAARDQHRRVLLLSTDPAHSLSDVLDLEIGDHERRVTGAPGQLFARELDAERSFALRRERYRDAVDELFNALLGGSRFDVAFDRVVVRQLIDLAPPGLDELFAILAVIEALRRPPTTSEQAYDTVVVDTAPTGHALRLLEMPAAALEWVHALLAILLKYRKVVGLGELAADLVEVARDLRGLGALLKDRDRAAFVVVTRPAELPRLETARLLARLRALGLQVPAVIVNRTTGGACARCRVAARDEARSVRRLARELRREYAMILAPARPVPPRGAEVLTRWTRAWTISDP